MCHALFREGLLTDHANAQGGPYKLPEGSATLEEGRSRTYSVSSITTSFQQVDAYLATYSVLRSDSAESVMVCMLSLEVEKGLRRRKSSAGKCQKRTY